MAFTAMVFACVFYPSLVRGFPVIPGARSECAFLALDALHPQVGWWCCPAQTVSWEDGKVVGVRNYVTERCRAVITQVSTPPAAVSVTRAVIVSNTSVASPELLVTRVPLLLFFSSVRVRVAAVCLVVLVVVAVVCCVSRLCLVRRRRAPVDTALVGLNLLDVSSAPDTIVTYL